MLIYLLHPLEKLKAKERLSIAAAFIFLQYGHINALYGKRGKNEINP
jgi:hypothetical protein